MTDAAGYDVFMSYTHDDIDFVGRLDMALRSNGLRVFLDERDIRHGDSLVESVFEGLARARSQVVVLSERSVRSAWVREELSAGRSRSIGSEFRVVPVLIEEVPVPAEVRHLKYLDMRRWRTDASFRTGVADLLRSLGHEERLATSDVLRWSLTYLGELHVLAREFAVVAAFMEGGEAEGLGNELHGTAIKWAINDLGPARGLVLVESLDWPADIREQVAERRRFPLSDGLWAVDFFVRATADGIDDPHLDALRDALYDCFEYLKEHDADGTVTTIQTERLPDLRLYVTRVADALALLTGEAIRLAVAVPAEAVSG